jgi:hypothetical protein
MNADAGRENHLKVETAWSHGCNALVAAFLLPR